MVIPVPADFGAMPLGPPPPDLADKMRPLGWCSVVILILCVFRAVCGDDKVSILVDVFVALAALMVLRDDSCFSSCGSSLLQCTQGFCGQGGVRCLMPLTFMIVINLPFVVIKAGAVGLLYNKVCMSGAIHQGTTLPPTLTLRGDGQHRFLKDAHVSHEKSADSTLTTTTSWSLVSFTTTSLPLYPWTTTHMLTPQELEQELAKNCARQMPVFLATLLIDVIVQMVMMCLACRALKHAQASMIGLDDGAAYDGQYDGPLEGRFQGAPAGFGNGFGGRLGGAGYTPDRPIDAEEAQLQQALAASVADSRGGNSGAAEQDAALQQALAISAAEAGGGNANYNEEAAVQEAIRQSAEEEQRRRERAAAAAEARAARQR